MQSPGLSSWELTNALLQFHLSRAQEEALGGELGFQFRAFATISGVSLEAAQRTIGTPGFGQDAQSLRPFTGLQEGFAILG